MHFQFRKYTLLIDLINACIELCLKIWEKLKIFTMRPDKSKNTLTSKNSLVLVYFPERICGGFRISQKGDANSTGGANVTPLDPLLWADFDKTRLEFNCWNNFDDWIKKCDEEN